MLDFSAGGTSTRKVLERPTENTGLVSVIRLHHVLAIIVSLILLPRDACIMRCRSIHLSACPSVCVSFVNCIERVRIF